MQTFTKARAFVSDPDYEAKRSRSIDELNRALESDSIDAPITEFIEKCNQIPWCFTLQSCYGHFAPAKGPESHSIKHLIDDGPLDSMVEYRIAYIAFCIQHSEDGRRLLDRLKAIPEIDRDYIQFGSSTWFWSSHVNTYVLQVEPLRYAHEDSAQIELSEAIRIESVRDRFYSELCDALGLDCEILS